jgi:hypothetical protein
MQHREGKRAQSHANERQRAAFPLSNEPPHSICRSKGEPTVEFVRNHCAQHRPDCVGYERAIRGEGEEREDVKGVAQRSGKNEAGELSEAPRPSKKTGTLP